MHSMTATHTTDLHRAGTVFRPFAWIQQALAVRSQRLRLQDLDDHLLADIGVDRKFAAHEARRPFWDLPR